MDEDKAFVGPINNNPKVWTIYSPDSEWAQCDCPIAREGMICKHTVKAFKMFCPAIENIVVVRKVAILPHWIHL